ncbi:MAG: LytTR family DNA-binding domain-containing protein [Chitinophagales bacterium]|nr:LytTR family DNA-binding domain-containing protein [Chitinophagales bacterium]
MRILIVEDEQPAARQLTRMLMEYEPDVHILDVLDSVENTVKWFQNFPPPQLVFMDIQLADGLSFDIFLQTNVSAPVIFTTAFDQYTLKAFKVNSIDYLLKPIDPTELKQALQKFKNLQPANAFDKSMFNELLQAVKQHKYKERFLVKTGQQLYYIPTSEILYAFAEEGMVFLVGRDGKKHAVDHTMEALEASIDPLVFFRINRTYIIRHDAIKKIHHYFNGRLKLDVLHAEKHEVIVSREKAASFKQWLDS